MGERLAEEVPFSLSSLTALSKVNLNKCYIITVTNQSSHKRQYMVLLIFVDNFTITTIMQVMSVVKQRPKVQKISFVAHSLGGLVARYAVGKLYVPISDREPAVVLSNNFNGEQPSCSTQCLEKCQQGRIAGLEPVNFITFATPHLGSRGHKQVH